MLNRVEDLKDREVLGKGGSCKVFEDEELWRGKKKYFREG